MADNQMRAVVTADISDYQRGLNKAGQLAGDFQSKVDRIGSVGRKLQSLGKTLSIGVTAPLTALAGSAVKAADDIEGMEARLRAVTGDAETASQQFERLRQVARLPGISLDEAVTGATRLQQIGFEAEQSERILSEFSNALSLVGQESQLPQAIRGFEKLNTEGENLQSALRRLNRVVPQVGSFLEEAFGTARGQELEEMGVTADQVTEVILSRMGELDRAPGSIAGAFQNMRDSISVSLSSLGETINETFDITGVMDRVSGLVEKAVNAFDSLSPAIQKSTVIVGGLVAAIGPLTGIMGTIMAALPAITAGFTALTGPIGLTVAAIAGIGAAVVSNWDKIKPYIVDSINWFIDLYNESAVFRAGIEYIAINFKTTFATVKNVLSTAWEIIKSFAQSVIDQFKAVGDVVAGAFTGDWDRIQRGVKAAGNNIVNTWKNIGNDLKQGAEDQINDVSDIIQTGIENVKNNQVEHVTLDDLSVSMPNLADDTKNEAEKEISKGLSNVSSGDGRAPVQSVEAPSIGLIGEYDTGILDEANKFAQSSEILNEAANRNKEVFDKTKHDTRVWSEEMAQELSQISEMGLSNIIGGTFSAIGQSIAQGGNVIEAAGNAALAGIGGVMQDFGKAMIQFGIAKLAIDKLFSNPFTAIAAGAALVALGAAISQKSQQAQQSLSNIGGGSSSGGGTVSTQGGSTTQAPTQTTQPAAPQEQNVVFEIEGRKLVGVLSRTLNRNSRLGGNVNLS